MSGSRNVQRRFGFWPSVAGSLARTTLRRLRRGPAHPSWPWAYELTSAFLHTAANEFDHLSIAHARDLRSPISPWVARSVELTHERRAGVHVERIAARAAARERAPVLLYLHGGGFVTCSPATHRDVMARIAQGARASVIAPRYRLAPEHPHPAALEDALAVYRTLLHDGISPRRIVIAGDSAGGNLALSLALQLRERGEPLPGGMVLISPWVDLSLAYAALHGLAPHDYLGAEPVSYHTTAYAGTRSLEDPALSPVHADLSGLPPLLVYSGGWELMLEQNRRLVARARAASVPVRHHVEPGMLHAYPCFAAILPQGRRAVVDICRFVREQAALDERSPDARAVVDVAQS